MEDNDGKISFSEIYFLNGDFIASGNCLFVYLFYLLLNKIPQTYQAEY